jgi:ribosomal protein RSM22 (predicted rRNA methylase)
VLLPDDLKNALESETSGTPPKELAKTVLELSDRYRNDNLSGGRGFIKTQQDAKAYAAFRMPATYAAAYSVLKQVREILTEWQPNTLLDAGAGPGTVMWAAAEVYKGLKSYTLLEREKSMIQLGKRLAGYSDLKPIHEAKWLEIDLVDTDISELDISKHDLVMASYVLGEINEKQRNDFVKKLWELATGMLIIIEPGTPAGFARIREARELIIAEGGIIAAPCPHSTNCPITSGDWCHFSQRISRSKLHRQVKKGELSYEDEKFSYIAVSRLEGKQVFGRVIRHPQVRKGFIEFEVCNRNGIEKKIVTRKNKEQYRLAKNLSWGDIMQYL